MKPQTHGVRSPAQLLVSWDITTSGSVPEALEGDFWRIPSNAGWVWAVGYIANRDELFHELGLEPIQENRELVYALYRRYGDETTKAITGSLTWMLWDQQRQILLCARDRGGNHNFYYTILNGKLWVSSQLEDLLGVEGLSRTLNPRSIIAQINGLPSLSGETFYEVLKELEPGGWMSAQLGKVTTGRYWQVELKPLLKLSSDDEYADALRSLLFSVVAQHVPSGQLGITLSSGLDSTSVAAALRHAALKTHLVAFCWAAPDLPEADESQFSSQVSRFLAIPEVQIRADLHWPMKRPDGICTSPVTPFLNIYYDLWDETYRVMLEQGVSIAVTGVSGDHLFGGNVFGYPDLLLTGQWLELTRQIRYHLPRSTMHLGVAEIIRRMILSPIRQTYFPGRNPHTSPPATWLCPTYDELYREHFARPLKSQHVLPGRLGRLLTLRDPLLPRIVNMMNRQAESHGVELRHPLLDHRLVEFAASLPTSQTFRSAQRKVIVRHSLHGLLPSDVLEMWDKIYPNAICERGLRQQEQVKVWRLLTNMRAAELGYVDEQKLRQAYQDYLAGKTDSILFWHTLTLEDWLRRWF